jgi:phospholipase/lecithinase/hemolysin
VANLTAHLTTLISRGAQTILVPNLPNLGNLPAALGTPLEAPGNLLTQRHNLGLNASVAALQTNFPGVKIKFLDMNSFVGDITVNPGDYGFTNVSEGCWLVSCAAPETYFYWDDSHFTTRGHQLMGDFAYQAVVPEPLTILGTLTAVGFGAVYKRRAHNLNP